MSDEEQMAKFFACCRELANQDLPCDPRINRLWSRFDVQEVVLGSMLARVAVSPRGGVSDVMLFVNSSRRAARRFNHDLSGNTLTLSGAIPFEPRSRGTHVRKSQSNNGNAPQGILVGGRKVKLDRCVDVMLVVPFDLPIVVSDMVGAVGIGAGLRTVQLRTVHPVHLYAPRVNYIAGTFGGEGVVTVDEVADPSSLVDVTGNGTVDIRRRPPLD